MVAQTQITQNPETQTLKTQLEELIKRSITEKRTIIVVVRYRSSDSFYNYQSGIVVIIKPKLEWEEEEAPAMLVDMALSVFDNVSLDGIENIIEELKEQYERDVYIEKISFF